MQAARKIASVSSQCVACGVCAKTCPLGAAEVYKGVFAAIDARRCVGCGKCALACPAGVITIKRGVPA